MAIGTARQSHEQQVHFLRKLVTYNDAGVVNGVLVGTVPAGSIITHVMVQVAVAFNAGTNNNLTVGTTGTGADIVSAAEAASGTVGQKHATAYRSIAAPFAQDQDIFVAYAQTGTAGTAGQAYVVVYYAPNIDR